MAVSAQALLDKAARLKERYPEANHLLMAEAVLAEREWAASVAQYYRDDNPFPTVYIAIAEAIRGGHQ